MKPEEFLGLTKKAAQDKAEAKNYIFRLVSIDGDKFFGYPEEGNVCAERVCIEIEKGKVSKAIFQ